MPEKHLPFLQRTLFMSINSNREKTDFGFKTYVNPIPLPNMPIGRLAYTEYKKGAAWREAADPTVLFENGKWYLFSSCGMAWVSEDFCTWKHKKTEPYDIGYAPTVVRHREKYLLCACNSLLYSSDNILGKYNPIGEFTDVDGNGIGLYYDPMLFSDDDGKLYLYYCVYEAEFHSTSIYGVELCADNPCRFASTPVRLIAFNPEHVWERNGENNEDSMTSAIEGVWLYKKNEIYYLVYSAPGTEYSTYALGAYKSKKPLSDFEYMKTSPFTLKKSGVVKGPGHGCIVDGPNNTSWVFYTSVLCSKHKFERTVGYDRIEFDENGDIICQEITDTPQPSPAESVADSVKSALLPVSSKRDAEASSSTPGRDARYAVTDDLTTHWEPENTDTTPTLEISLPPFGAEVYSVRIIWNEVGLDSRNGKTNAAIPYKLELKDENGKWKTAVDKTDSTTVMPIDYVTFAPVKAFSAKLTIFAEKLEITPGIYNITLFGKA